MKVDIVKIVNKDKKYTDSKGKEHTSVNYYIKLDNKQYIAIRPAFANGYNKLDVISELIINGKSENENK